jgi:hypothetical protein
MTCPKCGTKNPIGSVYCFNCGGTMIAARSLESSQQRRPRPTTTSLLHGLNPEESLTAIWKLLFSPQLRNHFGSEWSVQWCKKLIDTYLGGNHAEVSAQYNSLAPQVKQVQSKEPKLSMEHPPWGMFSLDMRIGLIPWVSFGLDRSLLLLLSTGTAIEKHFGDILPLAFVISGGPGNSEESAFRICAPSSPARASAEHWLMRAYLRRREEGMHATLESDVTGQMFSMHEYTDESGVRKRVFFETTESFGREEEDFMDFLHDEH